MNRPEKHRYPAILGYDASTKKYYVLCPNLPGCTTTGSNEDEAFENAREAISLHLWGMDEDGDVIPPPAPIQQLNLREYYELEMLFVDPEQRGKGIGRGFLGNVIDELDARQVDVNEQNSQSTGLYRHIGFDACGPSDRGAWGTYSRCCTSDFLEIEIFVSNADVVFLCLWCILKRRPSCFLLEEGCCFAADYTEKV